MEDAFTTWLDKLFQMSTAENEYFLNS